MSFQANVTYLSAKLTKAFSPGSGQPVVTEGTTLPGAAKWQIGAIASYQWRGGPLKPTLLVSNSYLSGSFGELTGSAGTLPIGGYDIINARLSLHLKPITFSFFVTNIGDAHGITQASISGSVLKQYPVRPRTVGFTLDFGI